MTCPYLHRSQQALPPEAESCPECGRFLKRCPQCKAHNRAFANFCRSCRAELPTRGNWLAFRGSGQRLGLNSSALPGWEPARWDNLEIRDTGLKLQLGENCRSLLGFDRHLVAFSQNGTIEIADPAFPSSSLRLKTDGPISCEPCIDQGILYLGSPFRLSAYSLGALTRPAPQVSPLWQLPLSGTPIQALTVLDDRLFLTVYRKEEDIREVQVVDSLGRNPPPPPRPLHAGARVSWLAADPASREAVFFSQDGAQLFLHTVGPGARPEPIRRQVAAPPLADQVPVAVLDGRAFGVFGDDEKLCRIDIQRASFETGLETDTKLFSLNRDGERGWDGDGVQVTTNGVRFLRTGLSDTFNPLERVKSGPILVQGAVAVLGMQDGRLRIYDLSHPPRHHVERPAGDGEPITALASFHQYVAAGNAKGIVKVLELRGKETHS